MTFFNPPDQRHFASTHLYFAAERFLKIQIAFKLIHSLLLVRYVLQNCHKHLYLALAWLFGQGVINSLYRWGNQDWNVKCLVHQLAELRLEIKVSVSKLYLFTTYYCFAQFSASHAQVWEPAWAQYRLATWQQCSPDPWQLCLVSNRPRPAPFPQSLR